MRGRRAGARLPARLSVPVAGVPRPLRHTEPEGHRPRTGRRRPLRARAPGHRLNVLAAPDKFRGTLTAADAARALAAGARDAGAERVDQMPLADGGEGTLDAILAARGGELRETTVTGPDGRPVLAAWGLLHGGTAMLELARASGLALVAGQNDAVSATTRGTGELIAAAAAAGATRVLLGVGG